MKIAYLGPEASFTQLATSQIFPNDNCMSFSTILNCFNAVNKGEVEKAVVPLENSIEGTVSMTLDYLYDFKNIKIEGEVIMPIRHQLLINKNNTEFDTIISHPQALAQCANFINLNFPDVEKKDFSSTSAAAKHIADHPEKKMAAIANSFAAKNYDLEIVKSDIQDYQNNLTRFVVISKGEEKLSLSKDKLGEKTSLLITLPEDHAGGLHQILSVFAWRKMNLSKIESRTLKTGLGNYFFYINVASNWDPILSENALQELRSIGAHVRLLGYYNEYLLED